MSEEYLYGLSTDDHKYLMNKKSCFNLVCTTKFGKREWNALPIEVMSKICDTHYFPMELMETQAHARNRFNAFLSRYADPAVATAPAFRQNYAGEGEAVTYAPEDQIRTEMSSVTLFYHNDSNRRAIRHLYLWHRFTQFNVTDAGDGVYRIKAYVSMPVTQPGTDRESLLGRWHSALATLIVLLKRFFPSIDDPKVSFKIRCGYPAKGADSKWESLVDMARLAVWRAS
jgi:hypothetical protein